MVKICSKCKKVFENVSITYSPSGRKKYQCADGSFFKDGRCSSCAKVTHKEYQRKKYGKSGALKSRFCPTCGKQFTQTHVQQVYCSKSCRKKVQNDKRNIKDKQEAT